MSSGEPCLIGKGKPAQIVFAAVFVFSHFESVKKMFLKSISFIGIGLPTRSSPSGVSMVSKRGRLEFFEVSIAVGEFCQFFVKVPNLRGAPVGSEASADSHSVRKDLKVGQSGRIARFRICLCYQILLSSEARGASRLQRQRKFVGENADRQPF